MGDMDELHQPIHSQMSGEKNYPAVALQKSGKGIPDGNSIITH
jgi:hypothetical protein